MAKSAKRNGSTKDAPKAKAATRTSKPKDRALPGMEDMRIAALERIAEAYVDIRDQRIELNVEEARLKQRAIATMNAHNKKTYKRHGIEIRLIAGEEDIKVRVKKDEDDAEETGTSDSRTNGSGTSAHVSETEPESVTD